MQKHTPRKRFGQNFLRDQAIITQVIDAISPEKDDHVVEIGPGQGALTVGLLSRVNKLDIVELDRDLIPQLKRLTEKAGQLTIYHADALKFNFVSIVSAGEKYRIVGNLPYNISTPLLFHLFSQVSAIQDMHFMLQKEVAERLVASIGTKTYGRLGIMARYFCQSEILLEVPPEAFYPVPKVHSAFVRLTPYKISPYDKCDVEKLSRIIAKAFMQRRKTLRNALKDIIDSAQLEILGIDSSLRPEQISLEQYIKITQI